VEVIILDVQVQGMLHRLCERMEAEPDQVVEILIRTRAAVIDGEQPIRGGYDEHNR
jgi:hypothetical protein